MWVTGGDGAPLLLVHGWPQTWYAGRLVMSGLTRNYRVVAPDQRGCGRLASPRTGTTPSPGHAGRTDRVFGLQPGERLHGGRHRDGRDPCVARNHERNPDAARKGGAGGHGRGPGGGIGRRGAGYVDEEQPGVDDATHETRLDRRDQPVRGRPRPPPALVARAYAARGRPAEPPPGEVPRQPGIAWPGILTISGVRRLGDL
jgi:hypothetical protein